MADYMENVNLIKIVYKWRKQLVIVCIASVVVSLLVSFLITPMFRSTAVVYPSNLIPYSSETPTEQMLQIFQSEDIKNQLIQKFVMARLVLKEPGFLFIK